MDRMLVFTMTRQHVSKLLQLCADNKNLRISKAIHAHWVVTNHVANNDDVVRANYLIHLYAKCDQISVARQLFDSMHKRNVVSWSSLMAGYSHSGCNLEVFNLFKYMVSLGNVKPNEYIFAIVFGSCSDSRKLKEGRQCHGYVLKSALMFHEYVRNALINMYSKCSDAEGAMHIFNSESGYDVFSYNSLLSGLVQHGHLSEGIEVLRRMVDEGLSWDSVTCVTVLGLCASLRDLKLGLEIHGNMLRNGIEFDVYVSGAIVNMYGKCHNILNARNVFEKLQVRNVVLWTAMMANYFQRGYFEDALNLFTKMEFEDILPNEFTFAILLNSTAGLSMLRHGEAIHACAEKYGFKDYLIVGNALINMYCKSGNIKAAKRVFSYMVYRDTITWNAIICGYSHHGLGKEALITFQDMLTAAECPNHITFVGVLSACSHLGLVEEGFYYLNQLMKQFAIEPGLEHYTCIVGLLSKAGRLDEAENFMRSQPVKWDVVAWRVLLNACLVHRSYGFGKRVADFVLNLAPSDVGTYILLSNIYARTKRWDGVSKIRKLMQERNIKKEPGVSWIEIRNITHVFVSDDGKHPECNKIYEKVKELLARIKPLGYVPDTAAVLHDVEDEQKEDYLSYHSEKMAIAYGLMKAPIEAPLHVFKNLRMCDDCHSAIKLISKVTNRVMIVRDANRFHHFQDGQCSCADYW